MQTPPGAFHWNELMTRDVAGAKAFYAKVCGWTFQDLEVDGMAYTIAMAGEQAVGGIFGVSGSEFDGIPDHWASYVAVPDVDAAVRAAEAGGGKVAKAPFEVTDVGRIAIVVDPAGAAIGLITPAPMPPS